MIIATSMVGLFAVSPAAARPSTSASSVPSFARPVPQLEVVLYGTSWCPACRQARQYFEEHHISFIDVDIEHDEEGRAEARRLAESAGLDPRMVPILKVGDAVFSGFSAPTVEETLRAARSY